MQFEIEENEVYLKNEDDKKVACVSFEKVASGVYNIYHTYVDESMRGRGIADSMLEFTVKHLKSIGARKIKATCGYAGHWLEKRGYTNE